MFAATFEKENKGFEQRKQISSVIITLLIHGLLLLILYLSTLSLPNPPYQDNEGGMSVNFGTSDVGTGDEQAYSYTPIASTTAPAPTPPAPASSTEEEVATQDIEDAPAIAKPEPVKKTPITKPVEPVKTPVKPTAATTTPTPPQPKADENALFKPGAYGKPNNSNGDGLGGGKGDQGELGGDPNSKSYEGSGTGFGTGNGDGIGDGNVRLAGRKLRFKPEVNDRSQAKGKVVIQIKVDRSGKVVDARYTQAGSTTSDEGLIRTSIEAAYKYRFDENQGASEIQTGAISFIYKVN
jgi:outer membrane biosynthesis protein TonB